jgi:hypothetical protein
VLWVDTSGDGLVQADECMFSTLADGFAGSHWGYRFADLTICMPAVVKGRTVIVRIEPKGYHPSGAPRYPALDGAIAQATAACCGLTRTAVPTCTARTGRRCLRRACSRVRCSSWTWRHLMTRPT